MDSAYIERTLSERGAEVLKDADKVKDSWTKAKRHSQDINQESKNGKEAVANIRVMLSMAQDYLKGDYKEMSKHSLTLLIGTIAYCASPLDLIPDPIPAVGLSDDIALILFATSALLADIITYKNWKAEQERPNSALTEYLDATVGQDPEARKAEINRLARQYDTVSAEAAVRKEKAREVST